MNGDGDFDELYTFEVAPSRSGTSRASLFTIVAMTLSKSRLRSYRKPSTLTTENNSFDSRSDDKGPEPEGVTMTAPMPSLV